MSKSSIAIVSFVLVSSLLLTACQPQANSAPVQNTSTTQNAPVLGSPEKPSATETSAGKKVSDQETYQSPAGPEKVAFTITVDQKGIITNAQTQILGVAPISKQRQESFAQELPKVIVGKKLSDLSNIDRVGGSSLTTGAFNAALTKLKAQL
jgi:hypothetical protein